MSEIELMGKKFWRIKRCSEDEQEKESFKQQEMTTNACATKHGIVITRTIPLPGYSATLGHQVAPILALIREKIEGADFDGFILDAYSRFARSDVDEARLWSECRDADLLVLTDKEGLMMGPGTWAKRGAATDQNEGYARDVGRHISRAVVELITSGVIPPTIVIPWGTDREYYDGNMTPMLRVRRLSDGRRAVLEPHEPHPVRYYIRKSAKHLDVLEDGWSYKLVPGDPAITAIIKDFARRHFLLGTRIQRLVAELNTKGIPSSTGRKWSATSLRKVLHSPLWLGWSIGFMASTGRHCRRTKDGPVMFPISRRPGYREDRKKRKTVKPDKQPMGNWFFAQQPKLVDFFDEDVRKVAEEKWRQRQNNGGRIPANPSLTKRNLPPKSRYFLSKLLCIKDSHLPMVGSDGPNRGKGKDVARYYKTRREGNYPEDNKPIERVRADLVEDEVKENLRSVLQSFDLHAGKIEKYIEEKKRELMGRPDDSGGLLKEKAELEGWYKSNYSLAGSRGRSLLAADAKRVETRLDEIDLQLAESGRAKPDFLDADVTEMIEAIRQQFKLLPSVIDGKSSEALRDLAAAFCSKLTYDPVTRTVEIEIGLPSWALTKKGAIIDVGTDRTPNIRDFDRTNTEWLILSTTECGVEKAGRGNCLKCHRRPLSPKAA